LLAQISRFARNKICKQILPCHAKFLFDLAFGIYVYFYYGRRCFGTGLLMEKIINYLKEMKENELIYKEYYELSQTAPKEEVDAWVNALDPETVAKYYMAFPQTFHKYKPSTPEALFFAEKTDKNLFVHTHLRFQPPLMHSHESFELVYVLEGRAKQMMLGTSFELNKGDFLILSPDMMHCIEHNSEDTIIIAVLICKRTFHDFFLNLLRSNNIISDFFTGGLFSGGEGSWLLFHLGDDVYVRNSMLSIYKEDLEKKKYYESFKDAIFSALISYILREYESEVVKPSTNSKPSSAGLKIIEYIEAHYSSGISLKDISAHFGYSEDYISVLIKKESGMNFSKILTSIRLNNAAKMLSTTTLSIAEIGAFAGYQNTESFIRAFKKFFNLTPSQYR